MSVENGKVCSNCQHCIRELNEYGECNLRCEIDNCCFDNKQYFGGWCRHWTKERGKEHDRTDDNS